MTAFYDYWLKGEDEAHVQEAMAAAGLVCGFTQETSYSAIGTIWVPGPDVDEEGNPIPVPLPGWHANLRMRMELTEGQQTMLASVLISPPNNPVRMWA